MLPRHPTLARVALGAVLLPLIVPVAGSAAGAAAPAPGKALVRLAHFAENVAVGDIYVLFVNGRQKFDDVPYKTVSDYLSLDPGEYHIEVRGARAPSTAPAEAELTVSAAAGHAYTVCVWGESSQVSAMVLNDDLTEPAASHARMRAINALAGGTGARPPVDLALAGGRVLVPAVRGGSASDYVELPQGVVDLELRAPGGQVLARSSRVTLDGGSVVSVAAIGGSGKGDELLVADDAASAGQAPAGGVATGAGGTAPRPRPGPPPGVLLGLLLSALVALVLGRAGLRPGPAAPAGRSRGAAARAGLLALILLLALPLGGCARGGDASPPAPAPPERGSGGPPAPAAGGGAEEILPLQTWPRLPASPPVRLEIPAIGVASGLITLGLRADGSMQVPEGADYDRAGWFRLGPEPGALGPAVIAGHVDSRSGPSVFFRLHELRSSAEVHVQRADRRRLTFVVETVRRYPKAGFPTEAVFGPVRSPVLRLVTCGGEFDRDARSYRDNVVVSARLASGA